MMRRQSGSDEGPREHVLETQISLRDEECRRGPSLALGMMEEWQR
jgi:hypothetical protein